jgi:hypothetical protein
MTATAMAAFTDRSTRWVHHDGNRSAEALYGSPLTDRICERVDKTLPQDTVGGAREPKK